MIAAALPFIVLAPLAAAIVAGLGHRAIGAVAAKLITTGVLFAAALLSWLLFVPQLSSPTATIVPLLDWFTSGDLEVAWSLRFDTLTAVMLVVVTSVSALVHLYSWGYMAEDPAQPRFFAYLSLFTFAMLMLVTADNLVQMFFGWEGVGLASYLLIGFWYHKPSANAAAIKAFVVNRIGDFGYALGIFGVFLLFGSVQFSVILASPAALSGSTIDFLGAPVDALTLVCLLLFVGAMGKSAQVPLHTWLPDAMEGPTPVSALIHAATMVTAGVFLVCRMSPLFEAAPDALTVVTYVGALTALFAATVACVQTDIKRVIAYSTCSQLGYMFFAAGSGAYGAAMFHLFTHAFFKALLFLGAGSVIHAMHHEQDMRHYGGLRRAIPLSFAAMMVGTLAITGVVPFAGYFSKDAIIESAFAAGTEAGYVAFAVALFVAFLTAFYSWRLILLTFAGRPRWDSAHHHPHESPPSMLIALGLLAIGAIGAGLAFEHQFLSAEAGPAFWARAIAFDATLAHAGHDVPAWVAYAPWAAWIGGLLLAMNSYWWNPGIPAAFVSTWRALHDFLIHKWYFDELYEAIVTRPATALGRLLWRGDRAVIDRLGADGLAGLVTQGAGAARRLQSGYVYSYAFVMLVGAAAGATWLIARG